MPWVYEPICDPNNTHPRRHRHRIVVPDHDPIVEAAIEIQVEEESIVVQLVEDLEHILASDEAGRDCRGNMYIREGVVEGKHPRSFGEGLATFWVLVRSLILNLKDLQGDVFFDVCFVFLADCRFEFANICLALYGNAYQ